MGIGGVGMSGIAEVLRNLGYPVSGSDQKSSETTRRLKKRGVTVSYGHDQKNIAGAGVVVVSSAIKPHNPEVMAAREAKIPIVQRAEMLSELMRFSKYGIAVAGTHGKTTTTSLIACTLYSGGHDPTMIIGGKVNNFKSNARLGKGEFMVAEADESDGSFLKLSPSIAVITNIDREHMDFYGDFAEVVHTYSQFIQKLPFYGAAVCCIDHPVVRELVQRIEKRVLTYGFSEDAQFRALNVSFEGAKTSFDLQVMGEDRGRITLNLAGSHNVLNSLAAIAVAEELKIPMAKVQKALRTFKGIHRRCEVLLQNPSVTVIDDYGHHPEEIKATLKAVRGAFAGRLVALFQPHRYSRTKDLFPDFLKAFDDADVLLLTDIYAAGEAPIDGIHSSELAKSIRAARGENGVHYLPKDKSLIGEVVKMIRPGDVLLSLGAGDVTHMGRECAKQLKKRKAAETEIH